MPTLKLNTHTLNYLDVGQGQPVLLLHGLGSCAAHWQPQIDLLVTSYRVIAPDCRGHGGSGAPAGPYSIRQLGEDAQALLAALAIERAHVIGYSLGGMTAFELALNDSGRVQSLVIINSGPHVPTEDLAFRLGWWWRRATVRLFGLKAAAVTIAGHLFPQPAQAALAQQYVESMSAVDKQAYLALIKAFVGWTVMPRLHQITAPTLVLSGDNDYSPVAYKQMYTALIPGARLQVIANSTHATPMDQPEQTGRLLLDFLTSH